MNQCVDCGKEIDRYAKRCVKHAGEARRKPKVQYQRPWGSAKQYQVLKLYADGDQRVDIASKVGLSQARVNYIIRTWQGRFRTDWDRAITNLKRFKK